MTVPPQLNPGEESRDPKGNEGCQEEGTLDRQKQSKAGCGPGPLPWSSGCPSRSLDLKPALQYFPVSPSLNMCRQDLSFHFSKFEKH